MKRNFSMNWYWEEMIKDWKPLLSFQGETRHDWETWRDIGMPKLMELIGTFPKRGPMEPCVEYSVEDGNLIRERVVFNSEVSMSVPCQVLRPKNMKADGSNPAILCSHGHGLYGKDPVAGMKSNPDMAHNIERLNYNYAQQLAEAGFLTISPDLRVFGERSDGNDPFPGRDSCNVNFIKGAILGVWTLTLNIWDMKCCIDYLETRDEVDPNRIGMMGLSQGGTMTTFTAAIEPRIKAADIIGYLSPWRTFAIQRSCFCGSQILPSVHRYFDTHDIAGMIAPRPLLIEMGIYDNVFMIEDQLQSYERVKKIYEAADAADKLWKEVHSRGHAFGGNRAFDFFKKYL